MSDEAYKCLVVVRLKTADVARLARDYPKMQALFARLSLSTPEIAFRSESGALFGLFIQTTTPVRVLRAEWDKSDFTLGDDALLAFDVGQQIAATEGFTRAAAWLQRH